MFKRILFSSKFTIFPFTFLGYSVFKSKYMLKMQADNNSQEKLLQNIDERIYHLEKRLNDKLEKENFHLLLEGDILIFNAEYPSFSDNNNSILRKILTQDLWKKFYNSKTKEGFRINDIIQCGIDNQSDHIGAVALSAESYSTFNELFLELSNEYHKKDIKQTKFENESYPMLKSFIMNLDTLLDEYCVSFEVRAARNLSDYPFSPKISRGSRKALGNLVKETLCKIETNVFSQKGSFSGIENMAINKDPLFSSAGVYRDWPNDRLVYTNSSGSFSVLINGEDHLNINQTNSSDQSQKNSDMLLTFVDFLERIENDFILAYNETLGFLNISVKNIGSGIYFTFKFKISGHKEKQEDILKHFEGNPDVTVTIKNEGDAHIAEFKNTNTFYNLSSFIIDLLGIKKNFID